jgi:hypothetical protein
MSHAQKPVKREAVLMMDRQLVTAPQFRGEVGDWLCVARLFGIAVAVTMAPFILL